MRNRQNLLRNKSLTFWGHLNTSSKERLVVEINLEKFIMVILSDIQQPTTPTRLLINHHGCCEVIKNP